MKKTPDYDDVFKTMKTKHKELFIPLINELYGTHYSMKDSIELLSSEGYVLDGGMDGKEHIDRRESDFLMRIAGKTYLIECQSYEDGSMAIRIAEYAFLAARNEAWWDEDGCVRFQMPEFVVIYVRSSDATPKETRIRFVFPDGESVVYASRNILLADYSKEYIIQHKLYPYIPFYIARYVEELVNEKGLERVERDLIYLQSELSRLRQEKELDDSAYNDMIDFIMIIIRHIADGNSSEERLVEMMGGTVFLTRTERDIEYGRALGLEQGREEGREEGLEQGTILTYKELGLPFDAVVDRVMYRFDKTREEATKLVKKYWS